MLKTNLNDLLAFVEVAQTRSFTKAAAKLGVSRSALSHTLRGLEARLGLPLLHRTTRSVSPTPAGEKLLRSIGHHLTGIGQELEALNDFRAKPVGRIRITAAEHACNTVLLPRLGPFLAAYPDIHVEVVIDYGLTDIVAQRFDAGIRSGGQVAKDMVAVRIGPDLRMAVVATPDYFTRHPVPKKPQDLTQHNCINMRLPTHDNLHVWEFKKNGREVKVRVEGQFTVNSTYPKRNAVLAGVGLACMPEDLVLPHLQSGELVRVLEDWCPSYSGYHLYYPSRSQSSQAFSLLVQALRYRK